MKFKNSKKTYFNGNYKCLACGAHGSLKGGIKISSVCEFCKDYMILPKEDLEVDKGQKK